MNPLPDDIPGLSKRRYLAWEAQRRAIDETDATARKPIRRKETAGEILDRGGERPPKRKRARRSLGNGLGAARDGERASWAFSEETVEAYYDVVSRIITPRAMAQEARREGNPAARPRDYRG